MTQLALAFSEPAVPKKKKRPPAPEPLRLDAPSDRHLPPLGVTVARSLEAGDRVTVHFWPWGAFSDQTATWKLALDTPGLVLDRRTIRIERPAEGLRGEVRWRDVFYVEAEGADGLGRFVDPARLYDLPIKLARELAADNGEPTCRDTYQVQESLRRALEHPERFNRAHRSTPNWETPERAADTARKLAEWPDADAPHEVPAYGPWCADYGLRSPRDARDPVHLDALAQLGIELSADGRMRIASGIEHNLLQGPARPEGRGVGALDYWKDRLRALDGWPSWLNGVPVRRLSCSPARFEVGRYELTAEAGLGTGARQRITLAMATLHEAAELVRAGRYPHYQYSRGADRWTETS